MTDRDRESDADLYADAKAENACFETGHPLQGDRCACGVVARAIRHRTCHVCSSRIRPEDASIRHADIWLHAECWNTPEDAA